jgi:hypothetical protein
MTIKIIKEEKNPRVLIVTPLLPGHKVSKETKKTLKRNSIPFTWITSEGHSNIPTNLENGLNWYEKKFKELPDYYMMIDRDIVAGRKLIDRLYSCLVTARSNMKNFKRTMDGPESNITIAYAFASFEFTGYIKAIFPAVVFDPQKLRIANYISSNSLFHTKIARSVGLVKDDKYKRLLDWAFLLKLLNYGYTGVPCQNASFKVISTKNDISAGSDEDYRIKSKRVVNDFVS